jgi:hypothetical protein
VNQFNFIAYDDPVYVTQNSHIQSGITLDKIFRFMESSCMAFLDARLSAHWFERRWLSSN